MSHKLVSLYIGDGEYYTRTDADAVIADLKADYKEACGRLQTANLIKDEQLAATRHSKHKRCLNKAECTEKSREWAKNHRDKARGWSRNYYNAHKEERNAASKKWRDEHKEIYNARMRAYRKRIREQYQNDQN